MEFTQTKEAGHSDVVSQSWADRPAHQEPWGCSRSPQQPPSPRAHRQARTHPRPACSLGPTPQPDDSQRREPQGKPGPGVMHQGPADVTTPVPSTLTSPPPRPSSAHHLAPAAQYQGGERPLLCCEHQASN